MISFAVEPVHRVLDEGVQLFEDHYHEIADTSFPLTWSREFYDKMDKDGKLQVHTVREDDRLVGYHFWMAYHHSRYPMVVGESDVFYLQPGSRLGWTAYRFLKFSVDTLRAAGCQKLFFHTKVKHNFGKLILRMGGKHAEEIYTINL